MLNELPKDAEEAKTAVGEIFTLAKAQIDLLAKHENADATGLLALLISTSSLAKLIGAQNDFVLATMARLLHDTEDEFATDVPAMARSVFPEVEGIDAAILKLFIYQGITNPAQRTATLLRLAASIYGIQVAEGTADDFVDLARLAYRGFHEWQQGHVA